MVISPDDLEFSVLRIFERLRIAVDGELTESDLIEAWRKTRLRRNDLKQGLALLITQDALRKIADADNSRYRLTQEGFDRTMALRRRPIRSALHRMRIQTMISLMRNNHSANRYRRSSD